MIPKGLAISKRRLVLVEWTDAAASTEATWHRVDSVIRDDTPFTCFSVGWIMSENTTHITVAPHFGNVHEKDGEQVTGFMHIPKPMIRRMRRLKL